MEMKHSGIESSGEDLHSIAELYVLDVIKSEHPEWVEQDGTCEKCIQYYSALDDLVEIEE